MVQRKVELATLSRLLNDGTPQAEIARIYNCSQACISRCISEQLPTWREKQAILSEIDEFLSKTFAKGTVANIQSKVAKLRELIRE